MALVENIDQLNAQIGATFDQAFSALRREVQDRLREGHQDLQRHLDQIAAPPTGPYVAHEDLAPAAAAARAEGSADAAGRLRNAFADLDRARTQVEVLGALLTAAAGFCSRSALLLVRGNGLQGWGAQGFGPAAGGDGNAAPAVKDVRLSPAADSAWQRAVGIADAVAAGAVRLSAADCAVLCGPLESPMPASGVLVPLVLRDRVVAVLYGDDLASAAPVDAAAAPAHAAASTTAAMPALQSLAYVAALAIETLAFRHRAATASLISADASVQEAGAAGSGAHVSAASAASDRAGSTDAADRPADTDTDAAGSDAAGSAGAAGLGAGVAGLASLASPAGWVSSGAVSGARITGATPALAATPAAPATPAIPAPAPAPANDAGEAPAVATHSPAASSPAAPAAATGDPGSAQPSGGARPAGLGQAQQPFGMSPTALYDSPRVPLVQRTAEIPRPWPVRPLEGADSRPEPAPPLAASEPDADDSLASAAGSGGAATSGDGGHAFPAPQVSEPPAPAAADRAPAVETAAAGTGSGPDNATVLLPPVALREAGVASWARKGAEAGMAQGPSQERESAAPADTGDRGAAAQDHAAGTFPAAVPPVAPVLAGPGSLRAVAPLAPASPDAALPLETSQLPAGLDQDALPARPPLAPVTPLVPPAAAPAFEPLRGGALGSATPEVRPPSGVHGPGWAFATTRMAPTSGSGDDTLHEEARRLARLLVSEIKLYNEEQVEAGRRNRDIYERLREDIDRSRQMYEERVDPRIVKSTDYFYQELVRILASGDAKALGI